MKVEKIVRNVKRKKGKKSEERWKAMEIKKLFYKTLEDLRNKRQYNVK